MEKKMDLQSMINDLVKGNVAEKIGDATGTDQSTVEQVVEAGLPVILGQLGNNASTPDGATELDKAVEKDHTGGSLLDSLGSLFSGGDTNSDGGKILDHVLGDNKTAAGQEVSKQTGVDVGTVAKILTFLAPLVMAYLGKKKTSDNLDAGGLSDLLKNQTTSDGNPLTQLATSVLDKNGNGSFVDDVVGGLFGKQ